ncbi:MAG: hypothetical protein EOO02_03205 [Chitinophagaceae bacterium]|nr:MAG: hypothetical protein EOO02_03205 [Chitinophagaceae bacterium]
MNSPVSDLNINLKVGGRIRPELDLRNRVNKVIELEEAIKRFDPSFVSSPFFDKRTSFFTDPTNNSDGSGAITPEKQGLAWQIVQVLDSYNKSIDKTTAFLEGLAKVIDAGGVPLGSLLELMNFIQGSSQQNQFAEYFAALMTAIKDAHQATVQADYHQLMESIQTSVAKAKSAAQGAIEWSKKGKVAFDTYFVEYDADSREAVNEMLSKARWLRVYDVNTYKQWDSPEYRPWSAFVSIKKGGLHDPREQDLEQMSPLVEREQGNLVWDYQLALPALLYAINARLTVLQTFHPDFKTVSTVYRDEIYTWINFLKQEVMPRFQKAIIKEDNWNWFNFSSTNYKGHFCWNIYSGEFVTGDGEKDQQFIAHNYSNGNNADAFTMARYYALYTPLVSGTLSMIKNLHHLANLIPVWTEWKDLGGKVKGEVGAIALTPKLAQVFARGDDNGLYMSHCLSDSPANKWELLDDSLKLFSSPVAIRCGNFPAVFSSLGNGNVIYKANKDGKWLAWENLGGVIKGDVAAVTPSEGTIDLYVRGSDNALWQQYFANGKWSGWFKIDGSMPLTSSPVVISHHPNHRAVFVHSKDGTIFHKKWDGSKWHPWESLGKSPQTPNNKLSLRDVAALSEEGEIIHLFVQGDGMKFWQRTFDKNWGVWSRLDDSALQLQSAPVPAAYDKFHRFMFATGWDGKIYYAYDGDRAK